jgi:predicted ATPase
VPTIAGIDRVDLGTPVTLLAGDKGTGTSTVVELIAEAMGFAERYLRAALDDS